MASSTELTTTVSPTALATMTTSYNQTESSHMLVPMTTPFSMSPGCFDIVWAGGSEENGANQSVPQLTQNLDNVYHDSCWPDGEFHASYSPAVCPSGWTYYSILAGDPTETILQWTSSTGASTSSIVTSYTSQISALCCPRDTHIPHPCYRTITSGELSLIVTHETNGVPTPFDGAATLVVPTPLTVFWHASDASTLTPRPPDLPENSFAPSWVPGQPVVFQNELQYDDSPRTTRLATGVFAAVIAVPIIIFLAILGCCICCFRYRRRREKREIAKEQEESQALAVERTSTQERTPNQSTDGEAEGVEQGRRQEAAAVPVAAGSSVTAGQRSPPDAQPHAADELPAGNTIVHSLSGISKPPYPGLPTHGFDGIEEPPPYAEAAPSYPIHARPAATLPTPPTQEHTERTTHHEGTNPPAT
ncbi:hypothetical protein CCM_06128 [Cordyceps militaris CM01]|uniref:Uncharacterized protein n=1 Tax=Cordyceps militaris (strain CM01) TaxID=983644 RepID=G3JIX4_CORMM|nr:uncharacterized protein CCM_06128 [Cordyceps militaris CM01]EGX91968.1 hypothetical protein CCM_06128 [Cordyceps militaris CM01]